MKVALVDIKLSNFFDATEKYRKVLKMARKRANETHRNIGSIQKYIKNL